MQQAWVVFLYLAQSWLNFSYSHIGLGLYELSNGFLEIISTPQTNRRTAIHVGRLYNKKNDGGCAHCQRNIQLRRPLGHKEESRATE